MINDVRASTCSSSAVSAASRYFGTASIGRRIEFEGVSAHVLGSNASSGRGDAGGESIVGVRAFVLCGGKLAKVN